MSKKLICESGRCMSLHCMITTTGFCMAKLCPSKWALLPCGQRYDHCDRFHRSIHRHAGAMEERPCLGPTAARDHRTAVERMERGVTLVVGVPDHVRRGRFSVTVRNLSPDATMMSSVLCCEPIRWMRKRTEIYSLVKLDIMR